MTKKTLRKLNTPVLSDPQESKALLGRQFVRPLNMLQHAMVNKHLFQKSVFSYIIVLQKCNLLNSKLIKALGWYHVYDEIELAFKSIAQVYNLR